MSDPISRLLDAHLAVVDAGINASGLWFYGDIEPLAESAIRTWVANTPSVALTETGVGFHVVHKARATILVDWYPSYKKPVEPANESWSPAQVVQP